MTDFILWFARECAGLVGINMAIVSLWLTWRKSRMDAARHQVEIEDLIWIQRHVSDLHRRVDILEGKDIESEGE